MFSPHHSTAVNGILAQPAQIRAPDKGLYLPTIHHLVHCALSYETSEASFSVLSKTLCSRSNVLAKLHLHSHTQEESTSFWQKLLLQYRIAVTKWELCKRIRIPYIPVSITCSVTRLDIVDCFLALSCHIPGLSVNQEGGGGWSQGNRVPWVGFRSYDYSCV